MSTHLPVVSPPGCASLDVVYGSSTTAVLWMPVGQTGEEILAKAKQTEAERKECIRRGAE